MNTLLRKFPRYQITTLEWVCDFVYKIASFFFVQFAALALAVYAVRDGLSLDINEHDILTMDSSIASVMYSFFLIAAILIGMVKLLNTLGSIQFLPTLTNRLVNPLFVSCGLVGLKYLGVTSLASNYKVVFFIFAAALVLTAIRKPVSQILFRRAQRILADDEGAIRLAFEGLNQSTWTFRNSPWLYTINNVNRSYEVNIAAVALRHSLEDDDSTSESNEETASIESSELGVANVVAPTGTTKSNSLSMNDWTSHKKRVGKTTKRMHKSARAKRAKHTARRNRSKQRHI